MARPKSAQTLSLNLRGYTDASALESPSRAVNAAISVGLHGAIGAGLLAAALFGAVPIPDLVRKALPIVTPSFAVQPPRVDIPRPPKRVLTSAPIKLTLASNPTDTAPSNTALAVQVADPGEEPMFPTNISTGDPGASAGGVTCDLLSPCGPALPATPSVVRIGGIIDEPKLIESRTPVYPPIALAAGVSGLVKIEAHFGTWDPLESTCRHASLSIL